MDRTYIYINKNVLGRKEVQIFEVTNKSKCRGWEGSMLDCLWREREKRKTGVNLLMSRKVELYQKYKKSKYCDRIKRKHDGRKKGK